MIVGSIKEDASLDKRISITPETAKNIKNLGYNLDDVIGTLQRNLIQGDLNLPEGLKKESFVDD